MTDDVEATQPAHRVKRPAPAKPRRKAPRRRPTVRERAARIIALPWLPIVVGIAVILAGTSLYLSFRDQQATTEETVQTAKELSDPILELCVQGGAVAQALAAEGKCALAEQVRADPTAPDPLPEGPDRDEVAQLIQAEVAKLTLPPGRGPTSGQLQQAARDVILANPELFRGPAGNPPSDVAVAAAVNAWFEANAERLRGPAGENGEPGDDGPPGAACTPDIEGCRGPQGEPGQDAPRVTAVELVRTDPADPRSCVMRVTTDDGRTYDAPASPGACPP